jgi:general secretion pathway protein F
MPVYEYKGLIAGNRSTRGMVDADSPRAARSKLRAEGIFPTQLAEGKTRSVASEALSRFRLPELRRVPALDLSLFTNQLATLIGAGIPLVESLSALTEQVENTRLKTVIGRLRESVNHGSTLGDAMAEHPHVFSDLYQSMVRAGESAGALELVLTRLSKYIEGQMELSNKVISAMMYPLIMIGMSLVVMGVLLVKVIPTIAGLLEDLNQPLPLPTLVVIWASKLVTDWWLPASVTLAATFLIWTRYIQTVRGRLVWDRLRLRLPVLGRVVRYVSISRFARTLATLLEGGLNIVAALDISKRVSANAVIGAAIDDAKAAITKGATIAGPLRQSGQFPPMVMHMVSVGEASGELSTMLAKVADTYDELVRNSLNRFTALMGPTLLILVALLVVMVILSTLLPLMNLTAAL